MPIAAAAFEGVPISVQAIATAYGDYTRKSFEQTRSFVDKLTRVRSLDKALEVQIEFARQAYETFVGEMQKICGLHNALAKQSLKPLERFMTNTMRGAR
ncbi:MAG: phasin family protein [Bradyrhizobium sp.]